MSEKLKTGWRTWRFDQMAVMVNDRIDDPAEAKVDHYVGLEHLDSDSLTIRRWGSPSDVEATKLVFRKGDIIFGRRRAYQRKLGVAPFDGICSAHALVLRAKTDVVLKAFLPFFMQSDLFMERAKQISVGSLSPTINWKTLAAEEFVLPPLDEQRRITEVLEAVHNVREKLYVLHHATLLALDSLTDYTLSTFPCEGTLSKYCDVNPESLSQKQLASSEFWEYADLSSVEFPMKLLKLQQVCLQDAPSRAQRIARDGDLLVSTVRPNLKKHAIVSGRGHPIVASTGFAVVRPYRDEHAIFLMSTLLSARFVQHCEGCITGTAYPAIRSKDVANFAIPDLDLLKKQGILDVFASLLLKVDATFQRQDRFSRLVTLAVEKEVMLI